MSFIPDAASTASKVLIEVKDVAELSMSNQLRGYFSMAAEVADQTVSIIVSPKTENITKPVMELIESYPNIVLEVFDSVTGTFSKYSGKVGGVAKGVTYQ